jgi:hypothetical protein
VAIVSNAPSDFDVEPVSSLAAMFGNCMHIKIGAWIEERIHHFRACVLENEAKAHEISFSGSSSDNMRHKRLGGRIIGNRRLVVVEGARYMYIQSSFVDINDY